MDEEKQQPSASSDNTPMPITDVDDTPAEIVSEDIAPNGMSRALETVDSGLPPTEHENVREFDREFNADDSMRGGYATVDGKKVPHRDKFVWIVIAVMTVMCLVVGICSSYLTAHFMRGGEKPPVINIGGDIQQNITAVVSARKPSIAEIRCGTLSASGIVMKRDGNDVTVLTNAHAIEAYVRDKHKPAVRFYGEDVFYEASVVGYDGHYDVAVLTVAHNTDYTVYDLDGSEFFDPDLEYSEGDYVVSIGNAMGMGVACYDGIISKKSELLECNEIFGESGKKTVPVVRTTAVINAGMSGGGVFDMKGRLVGLGTYRLANSAGVGEDGGASTDVEDTGFATPISVLYPVYKRILSENSGGAVSLTSVQAKKTNSSAVGWLGLPFGFNCEYNCEKLTVSSLDLGTPAAGVNVNDVVVKIGDRTVTSDICAVVGTVLCYRRRGGGAALDILLDRNGAEVHVTMNDFRYAL